MVLNYAGMDVPAQLSVLDKSGCQENVPSSNMSKPICRCLITAPCIYTLNPTQHILTRCVWRPLHLLSHGVKTQLVGQSVSHLALRACITFRLHADSRRVGIVVVYPCAFQSFLRSTS